MSTTVQQSRRWCTQSRPRPLRLESAAVARRMFPDLPDAPSKYAISRARNGHESNPLYRLRGWLEDARREGWTSRCADEAIAYLESVRDELWADEDLCFVRESAAEQALDGTEDVAQQRALLEPVARRHYVEQYIDPLIAQYRRLRRAALHGGVQ